MYFSFLSPFEKVYSSYMKRQGKKFIENSTTAATDSTTTSTYTGLALSEIPPHRLSPVLDSTQQAQPCPQQSPTMDTTNTNITVVQSAAAPTPRARKRFATSPLQEIDVGSAQCRPSCPRDITSNTNNKSTHTASKTGSADPLQEKKLLDLRKQYHRTLSDLTKTDHHLTFLQHCKEANKIPKGLQIKVTPQAFLGSETDVNTEFRNITQQAEEALRDTLIRHYDLIHDALNKQREDLEQEMALAAESAPAPAQEDHQQILEKTTTNMAKRKNILLDKANRKMEILKNPSLAQRRNRSSSRPNHRATRATSNPKPKPQPSHHNHHQQRPNNQQPHQRPNNQRPINQPPNHTQPQRTYPSYASATQGFHPGGPGQNHPPNQLTRQPRKTLLPNPSNQTNPPTNTDTQQLILQTLTQLLQILQK